MLRLFKVICQGMRESHGTAYVVAENAAEAYDRVRDDLVDRNLGFDFERELARVELLAIADPFTSTKPTLYLPEETTR